MSFWSAGVNAISVAGRRFGLRLTSVCLITLAAAAVSDAALLDVIFYDNRFGSIDSSTGVSSQIANLPISKATGIALSDGSMYVEDFSNNLLVIDPSTGSSRVLGNAGAGLNLAAFGGGDAGLYGIDYASNLYSFNTQTGAATLVGSTGLTANNGHADTSLSFNGSSLLYTVGSPGTNDDLYRVNISTGAATYVGSTGLTAIAGSAFENGSLDLFQYGQNTNYVYSAPDGSSSFVRGPALSVQIIDGGLVAPGAVTISSVPDSPAADSAPEPATVLMAASALAALALYVGRKRRGAESRLEQ